MDESEGDKGLGMFFINFYGELAKIHTHHTTMYYFLSSLVDSIQYIF